MAAPQSTSLARLLDVDENSQTGAGFPETGTALEYVIKHHGVLALTTGGVSCRREAVLVWAPNSYDQRTAPISLDGIMNEICREILGNRGF